MSNKEGKYQGGTTHRMALLHAIGQLEIMNASYVKVSDIMPFMNVSKPTATKHLKTLANNNELIMYKEHDGRFGYWRFRLEKDMFAEFQQGIYEPYFKAYCQRVLKVILP